MAPPGPAASGAMPVSETPVFTFSPRLWRKQSSRSLSRSRPWSLPRLRRSPLHRIEESDAPEPESSFSMDSPLESRHESSNTANTPFLLTDSLESVDTANAATWLSTGLPLESFGSLNMSNILDALTDLPLETSNSANTLLMDSQLETPNNANTSFVSTDSSLQSYYAANTSFPSTYSSLQSYFTANPSFISTTSSLEYYTANPSVSSLSTIHEPRRVPLV
jgi:hypothetical protein